MKGLLLVNVGTPDSPSVPDVRKYLAEFLGDPRVLDMNAWARAALLHGVILRTRPAKSAHAYQQIWTEEGSPLLVHGKALVLGLQAELGPSWSVRLGMRYQSPSMTEALDQLQAEGIDDIVVFPLYPQYASAATGTTLERAYTHAAQKPVPPTLRSVPAFFDDPGFLDAVAQVAREALGDFDADHLLMSYHGLPERQVAATAFQPGTCRFDEGCCGSIRPENRACYRAQCMATSRGLADRLSPRSWSVSFQSRLGRDPWIKPWTDEVLPALAQQGHKRLAVVCPSFVADCLETVEEIGMRARDQWTGLGGTDFRLVPCVNAHQSWVRAAARLVRAQVDATGA